MFDNRFLQGKLPKKSKEYYKSKKSFNEKAIDRNLQNKVNQKAQSAPTLDNLNAKFKLEVELIKKQLEMLFSDKLKDSKVDLYSIIKDIMEGALDKSPNRVESIKKFLYNEDEKQMLLELCKQSLSSKLKS
jgi:hypothetical protein